MKFEREAFEFIDRLNRLSTIGAVGGLQPNACSDATASRTLHSVGCPPIVIPLPGIVLAHRIPSELFKVYVEAALCRHRSFHAAFTANHQTVQVARRASQCRTGTEGSGIKSTRYGFRIIARNFLCPIPSPAGTFGNVWIAGPKLELTARTQTMRLHLIALYAF